MPFCQRDYMWNLSRAILLARECIYIHDWWLSPGADCSDAYFMVSDVP